MKILSYLLSSDLGTSVITVAVTVLIIWLIREIVCWYWKVNLALDELRMINKNLTILIDLQNKGGDKKIDIN